MRTTWAITGDAPPGLRMRCRNAIPHSRGLGSSAAAAVGGAVAAVMLAGRDVELERDTILQVTAGMEGHADNAAASLLGGFVVAWETPGNTAERFHAIALEAHPDIRPVAFIAGAESLTSTTRAPAAAIMALLLAIGVGFGAIIPILATAVLRAVPENHEAVACGVLVTVQQAVAAVGVALTGVLLSLSADEAGHLLIGPVPGSPEVLAVGHTVERASPGVDPARGGLIAGRGGVEVDGVGIKIDM